MLHCNKIATFLALSVCFSCSMHDDIGYAEVVENKLFADSLYLKAWNLRIDFPDSAIYYAKKQMKVSENINYELGIINAHYVRGIAYNENRLFDVGAGEFYKALSYIKENDSYEYLRKKALVFQGLGNSYFNTYKYDMAVEMATRGLNVAVSIGYEPSISGLNYNLGVYFREKEETEKAIDYYQNALRLYSNEGYYEDVADVHNVLGYIDLEKGNYSSARKQYLKALSILDNHNIVSPKKSWYINNLGEIHFVQGQFREAEKFYADALEIAQEFDDTEKIKLFSNNLGDVYLKEGNYAEAIAYYQKSMEFGSGDDRIDGEIKRACKQLAVAYERLNDLKRALEYKDKFIAQVTLLEETKDKLMVQNAQYRMKEIEWQRQMADKETLLARLKSWLNSGLAVFALFLIVFVYISYRLYLHYTVHKEMKRILMTPISEELERLERKNKTWDDEMDS